MDLDRTPPSVEFANLEFTFAVLKFAMPILSWQRRPMEENVFVCGGNKTVALTWIEKCNYTFHRSRPYFWIDSGNWPDQAG